MTRVRPVDRESAPDLEETFASVEQHLGVLPNSTLTMAHRPEIMRSFAKLNEAVMGPGEVTQDLKQMVAAVVSTAAGCRYCQAHTSQVATIRGVPVEKVRALWDYPTSTQFTPAERAALAVAQAAGVTPNCVTGEMTAELARYFSTSQIVEIVAVISLFGFLNRWNDTLATELEALPLQFAQAHLAPSGWIAGSHASD
ncbi:MAG TPA: carboxymuconolactone decarboxylase family protein [Streptosporangiaceae bacterium]|nr:carboxymuconolactone decarboxylase family protein [Streptosporangiaceae bacterium]